jgi:DNA-binding response OmpR family regulator
MCSDNGDRESVMRCLKMGARDFIVKPFDPAKMIEKIGKVLQPKKAPRIMIVDDDEFILEILEKIVRREGYDVTAVRSANDALTRLEEDNIEVVISDIVMPEMDGMELLKEVKAKFPKTLMLMITGHSGKYGRESVLDSGADGFISKPFKNIEITRTIQRLLNNVE